MERADRTVRFRYIPVSDYNRFTKVNLQFRLRTTKNRKYPPTDFAYLPKLFTTSFSVFPRILVTERNIPITKKLLLLLCQNLYELPYDYIDRELHPILPRLRASGKELIRTPNCHGNLDRCSTTVNYTFTNNTKKNAGDRRAGWVGCLIEPI